MRKYLVFILLFLAGLQVQAQFTQAEVSVNGLTCSQCSRSVEMALKRLDFIAKVEMDLQQPAAHIVFKKGKAIDFSKLAAAVRDAGFSVRAVKAKMAIPDAVTGACFLDNKIVYFNAGDGGLLQQGSSLLLLASDLISKAELEKYKKQIRQVRPLACDQKGKRDIPFILLN